MAEILNKDLTTVDLEGSGIFDELMKTVQLRLDSEWAKNRIKGADYSKVYLGAMSATMQQSLAFLMGKQAADKQAELLVAQTANEVLNNTLIQSQINKLDADKLLVDQNLANAVIQGTNLTKTGLLLDQQLIQAVAETTVTNAQKLKIDQDVITSVAQAANIAQDTLVKVQQASKVAQDVLVSTQQVANLVTDETVAAQQRLKLVADTANATSQNTVIANQALKIAAEKLLLDQKTVSETAQTINLVGEVVDGTTKLTTEAPGVMGKQKMLYQAQTQGFARDAEQKLLKQMSDNLGIRISADFAGTAIPTGYLDPSMDEVITKAKSGIGIVAP